MPLLTAVRDTLHLALRDGGWLTLERLRGYCRILLVAYIIAIFGWIALADGLRDRAGNPIGTDFVNVYAAGLMTHDGHAALAYDWDAHRQVENKALGFEAISYYGWHYPPVFLIVSAIVAIFPYGLALALYMFGSLAGYGAALAKIVPRYRESWLAIAAFPGVFINLGNGQNGFITTGLLGGGLYLLENKPLAAGVLLGCLAYKPQFFIVVPIILWAGKQTKALMACIGTAAGLALLSLLLFGPGSWAAFFASTHPTQTIILEQGAAGWGKIQSLFAALRGLGAPLWFAYALQGIFAIGAIIATIKLWQQPKASLPTRAAALCAAVLMVTPYLFDYDLTVLGVPVAFLAKQALRRGFIPYEKSFLALVWVWPFLARLVGLHSVALTPVVLAILLGLCFVRSDRKYVRKLFPKPKES